MTYYRLISYRYEFGFISIIRNKTRYYWFLWKEDKGKHLDIWHAWYSINYSRTQQISVIIWIFSETIVDRMVFALLQCKQCELFQIFYIFSEKFDKNVLLIWILFNWIDIFNLAELQIEFLFLKWKKASSLVFLKNKSIVKLDSIVEKIHFFAQHKAFSFQRDRINTWYVFRYIFSIETYRLFRDMAL